MRRLVSLAIAGVLVLAVATPVSARPYVVKVFGMAGWTSTFIPVTEANGSRSPPRGS